MTLSNHKRAMRCLHAITAYSDDDARTNLVDFLADARHWCDQHGENYAELDRIAYQHYLVELVESRRRHP